MSPFGGILQSRCAQVSLCNQKAQLGFGALLGETTVIYVEGLKFLEGEGGLWVTSLKTNSPKRCFKWRVGGLVLFFFFGAEWFNHCCKGEIMRSWLVCLNSKQMKYDEPHDKDDILRPWER